MPAGGATDVPVLVIGQLVESVNLGLFNGVVDPRIALFGVGAVTTGTTLQFRKARGTVAAPTAITSGDDLGTISGFGYSGAGGYVESARILLDSTGTIATTRVGGQIVLSTATDAAPSVLTAALTIDAAQLATFSGGILLNAADARHIEITGAATSAQLYIGGTAILASGEQAIYINCPSETAATNGIWITLGSTVITGDLSGIRSRVYANAASAGASVRGGYLEAKMSAASKFAAMLEGSLSHADYSAGTATISGDVRGFTSHISQGAGLNAANLYGILISIQTRGDETITTDDVGLKIKNEAVGGNGRQMDAAILIDDVNMGGGTAGFALGVDFSGAVIATADIKFHHGSIILDSATTLTITPIDVAALVVNSASAALTITQAGAGKCVSFTGGDVYLDAARLTLTANSSTYGAGKVLDYFDGVNSRNHNLTLTAATAGSDIILSPDGAVTVVGGKVLKSSSATEIGLQVTNAALTVGTAGSIQTPYLESTGALFTDAIGGNLNGCIGLNDDTDAGPIYTLEARMNGAWISVALSGVGIPKRRDYKPNPDIIVHPNQIYKCDIWSDAGGVNTLIAKDRPSIDETICIKCGKPMVKGDQIHLFVNAVRKNGDLHALFAHANH